MADQSAETELLATMMLEGCETVPDGDTSTTTETVQREGDTECQAEGSQAEGSLGDDNLASSSSEDSQEEHTIGQRRAAGARARKKCKKDKTMTQVMTFSGALTICSKHRKHSNTKISGNRKTSMSTQLQLTV